MRTGFTLLLFIVGLRGIGCAQGLPSWHRAGDAITVVRTATSNGLSYAVVHDVSMREHSTYCIAVGAHIGGRVVIAIRQDGIVLSGGRVLHSQSMPANTALAATTPRGR